MRMLNKSIYLSMYSVMCIKDNGVNIVINLLNKHDLHRYVSPTIILFNQMARYSDIATSTYHAYTHKLK